MESLSEWFGSISSKIVIFENFTITIALKKVHPQYWWLKYSIPLWLLATGLYSLLYVFHRATSLSSRYGNQILSEQMILRARDSATKTKAWMFLWFNLTNDIALLLSYSISYIGQVCKLERRDYRRLWAAGSQITRYYIGSWLPNQPFDQK